MDTLDKLKIGAMPRLGFSIFDALDVAPGNVDPSQDAFVTGELVDELSELSDRCGPCGCTPFGHHRRFVPAEKGERVFKLVTSTKVRAEGLQTHGGKL